MIKNSDDITERERGREKERELYRLSRNTKKQKCLLMRCSMSLETQLIKSVTKSPLVTTSFLWTFGEIPKPYSSDFCNFKSQKSQNV